MTEEERQKSIENFSKLSTTDMARTMMFLLRNSDPAFLEALKRTLSPEERFQFEKLNDEITLHPENFQ